MGHFLGCKRTEMQGVCATASRERSRVAEVPRRWDSGPDGPGDTLGPAVGLDSLLSQLDPDQARARVRAHLRLVPAERTGVPGPVPHGLALGGLAGRLGRRRRDRPGRRGARRRPLGDPGEGVRPDYAIKKADVDSFLAESSRPGFTYRLLIATTDRLGPTAKRTLDDQREPVGYLLRSQLELAPVAWPASPDDLRPRRPARKKPFPHVQEAIKATVKGFKGTDRGQLLMACGTGKTLAAMWIAERLDSKRTLILLPSLSLLAQTLREWSANATKPFDYLAVCSDESVAGEDDFVQHTSELGLPVTTDPELIAAFLRGRGRRVVFATYQSSPQIAAAFKDRTPASTWRSLTRPIAAPGGSGRSSRRSSTRSGSQPGGGCS